MKHNHQAAAGFILRDNQGLPILASAKDIGFADVLVAEAMALREGLRQAILHGYSQIQVEGDSKIVIDCINGVFSIPWRIKMLIRDITTLAHSCQNITFKHIFREANFVADAIAESGHSLGVSLWNHSLPLNASNAFLFDQLGVGCCRGSSL